MNRTGRSRNVPPFVFLAIVLFAESCWLVLTFCPNNREWEIERLHWQMKVRLQRKDEEIRHLKNELRASQERYEVERSKTLQVEEERKQNEAQLRLKEKQILELELTIQNQKKTIHNLTVGGGQILKELEEYNQIREEQKAKEMQDFKDKLHVIQKSCESKIHWEQSRVEREQRQCEHQLSEKEKIIRKKDAVIWDERGKLQSMTDRCNQLWCVTENVAYGLLAILLLVCCCCCCYWVSPANQ